jgi:hypothetical protein
MVEIAASNSRARTADALEASEVLVSVTALSEALGGIKFMKWCFGTV